MIKEQDPPPHTHTHKHTLARPAEGRTNQLKGAKDATASKNVPYLFHLRLLSLSLVVFVPTASVQMFSSLLNVVKIQVHINTH